MVAADPADQRGEVTRVGEIPAQDRGEDKVLQDVPGGPDRFLII